MINVIAIGPESNPLKNQYTGQSIMFDGLVDYLNSTSDHSVSVVNISEKFNILPSTKVFRLLDYFIILLVLLFRLISCKYNVAYITTSQSKVGFYRDFIIINLLSLFKIKIVAHQFGANYKGFLDSLNDTFLSLLKKTLKKVDVIIVEGKYMKKQYDILECSNKIKIIPNGLPFEEEDLSVIHPKVNNLDDRIKILYLSNLIKSKGYFDILGAIDILVNEYHKNVDCVFCGKFMIIEDIPNTTVDDLKNAFFDYISEHGLSSNITYIEGAYGSDKNKLFLDNQYFILPTYYVNEGQPVSVIEAMAYGLVPIVTNYRHLPNMVDKTNGIYVERQSPRQIADAVLFLSENPEFFHTLSKNNIDKFRNEFTFSKYSSSIEKLIQSIII